MAGTGEQGGATINVVPLIDVVLVLLIIMMVVTPMLSKGVAVKLPKAKNAAEVDERKSQDKVIAVKYEASAPTHSQIYFDKGKDPLSEAELKVALASLHRSEPFTPLLVKADERVNFGEVRKIVLDAQAAEFKVVKVAAEGEKKKGGAAAPGAPGAPAAPGGGG